MEDKNTNKKEIVLRNGSGYIIIGKGFLIGIALIIFAIMLILSVFALGNYPRIINMTDSESGAIFVQNVSVVNKLLFEDAEISHDNIVHEPVYLSGQTGLNDLNSSGNYTGEGNAAFQISIEKTGTPDKDG